MQIQRSQALKRYSAAANFAALSTAAIFWAIGYSSCQAQEAYPADPPMPAYELPEALRMQSGAPVTTAAQWNDTRRKEILELFRTNVYGRVPATRGAGTPANSGAGTPANSFEQSFHVAHEDAQALGGAATLRQ